jgi:hypothetical protein
VKPNRDDQRRVVRVLGSGGMANPCQPLINAVKTNKPKTLTGLNQNGTWDGLRVSSFPQRSHQSVTGMRGMVRRWFHIPQQTSSASPSIPQPPRTPILPGAATTWG